MAVGDITSAANCKRAICLMTAQTANTGQPTDGAISPGALGAGVVPNFPNEGLFGNDTGASFAGEAAERSTLLISSTAGSGTMVGTFVLWGFLKGPNKWYPINVNAGAALAELASPGDTIRYQEKYLQLGHYDYLFLELKAVGGTATAFEAFLVTSRQETL